MSNTPISDGNRMHPVSERGIIRTSSGVLDADGAFVPYLVARALERKLNSYKSALRKAEEMAKQYMQNSARNP